jgi:hypothetical protein
MRWWHFLVLAACSSSTPPPSGGGTVGSNGGAVAAGDAAAVDIPPGALGANTPITITPTTAAAPDATDEVGTVYLFGPEGTQFEVPVTVTLAFDPTLLPTGDTSSDIEIFTAPAGTTTYSALATTIIDNTHVAAPTTHFSIFVAAAHHKAHQDGGVPDAAIDAVPDSSVLPDAATCTPVKSGSAQACTFSATCNGHTYSEQCAGASCTCSTDSVTGATVNNVGTTCFGTTGQPGGGACGFP